MNKIIILLALVTTALLGEARETVHHVIVEELRPVATTTKKSENAWAECQWCGKKIRYTKTYRWDVYNGGWIETTTAIPALCKKCEKENKELTDLRREEARLDRKEEIAKTRERIKAKKQRK